MAPMVSWILSKRMRSQSQPVLSRFGFAANIQQLHAERRAETKVGTAGVQTGPQQKGSFETPQFMEVFTISVHL